ncbi:MAG: 2-(1,2-epoxy-1,2-dihydrophenyl)acetyl-CoA isomerase [Gemmatimonadetes bacterium]|nr:MAG: 2-(1,2-epoxy-1,2-dihydrophenyl)acetyl-CoA isomerase [Gemmatimonadota bacterium]
MAYQQISYRREGALVTVTLNRPEKLNAFTFVMLAELNALLQQLSAEGEMRVLVLTGAGRAFSAGDDLLGMGGSDPAEDIRRGHHRLVLGLRALRVPVIAALNGYTLGAGFDLALACDFRVASEEAELGDVRATRAMCSMAGAAYWLPRMVGVARATEILLLGERISATRAFELGLVNRVAPRGELDAAVNALATQLLRLPTGALGAQKACLEFGLRHELPAALENEMQELIQGFAREDWHEAIRAFAGKRSPCFTGR